MGPYDGDVTDPTNPNAVARPATAAGAKAFTVTPFSHLARTHAVGTAADAMVAAAFAGSLFFSLPADGARWPVLRYLLITMLPFAVLSPLIGPMVDRLRGGHRFVVMGAAVVRGLLAYLLISEIEGAGTPFFILALCLLVGQKAYQVARSALVPSVVRSDSELVEANSKLSLLSGLSSFAGAAPAAALGALFGPKWSLGLAAVTYMVAAVLATRLPPSRVASSPPGEAERIELRGAGIVLAGSAMGVLRWCVGFLTLLIAFDFRGDRASWQLAVVAGASVLSQLGGAAAAPRLRAFTSEENLLTGSLVAVLVGGVLAAVLGDVVGAAVVGASVGFSAAVGKLAFDSILQRDAPDANRGRAFARFETRFQIMWVIGALIPVWITMEIGFGFLAIAAMALVSLASYSTGRMAWAHRTGSRQTAATAAALGIEERFTEVSAEVKGQIGRVGRRVVRRRRSSIDAHGTEVPYDVEMDGPALAELDDPDPDPDEYGSALVDPDDEDEADGLDEEHSTNEGTREYSRPGPVEHGADVDGSGSGTVVTDEVPTVLISPELGDDPDSWPEPEWAETSEFPWEPPTRRIERGGDLADVPHSLDNPYPWTPDPPDPRS